MQNPERKPADSVGAVWRGPLHPGELIRRRFFEPLVQEGMSQRAFCEEHGIDRSKFSLLLRGKREITPETAIELADAFGVSAMFFMNLQGRYDLEVTKRMADEAKGQDIGHGV
jgi:addiction module HigA family antidote